MEQRGKKLAVRGSSKMVVRPLYIRDEVCVSLIKSKIGFLNLDKSKNGFCVSLLNRLIQDHSDHGASKEAEESMSSSAIGIGKRCFSSSHSALFSLAVSSFS